MPVPQSVVDVRHVRGAVHLARDRRMKAHRGEVHDDPVVFAFRDWQSLLVVGLSGLAFSMAASKAIPT